MNTTQGTFTQRQPYNADMSLMNSTFQVGVTTQMARPNLFNSHRVSNSLGGGVKPIPKGTVALDLDLDMKKFKTWSKFN